MTRMNPLRHSIRAQVQKLMRPGQAQSPSLVRPAGDDGLFGPGSAVWAVHGDFTAMMIGGVSSLMLQMLHPAALAGVWDHSNFRDDMHGRLRRTAGFIGTTTRGSTDAANAAIARVRAIHDRVTGVLPDGTPYAANDPALLTWVHVAEARSFLSAYLRYRDPGFPGARQDAYFAEMAMLARRLGAVDVPETRRDVAAYLQAMRPELRCDARTRDVARTLLNQPATSMAAMPLQRILLDAGVELLPDWASAMHGVGMPTPRRLAVRTGGAGAGHLLRWALR
jgi:uncharacterized protein (DUF2236 family)